MWFGVWFGNPVKARNVGSRYFFEISKINKIFQYIKRLEDRDSRFLTLELSNPQMGDKQIRGVKFGFWNKRKLEAARAPLFVVIVVLFFERKKTFTYRECP